MKETNLNPMDLWHLLVLALSFLVIKEAPALAQSTDNEKVPDVAAKARYKTGEIIQQPLPQSAAEAKSVNGRLDDKKPKVVKSFGDLRIEIQSLQILDGNKYLLIMGLTNQNTNNSIWVALNDREGGYGANGHINDASGFECRIDNHGLSGIEAATQFLSYGKDTGYATFQELQNPHHRFAPALEIKPNDASTAAVKFVTSSGKHAESGLCTLQIEFLVGHDFNPDGGIVAVANLVTKIEAE